MNETVKNSNINALTSERFAPVSETSHESDRLPRTVVRRAGCLLPSPDLAVVLAQPLRRVHCAPDLRGAPAVRGRERGCQEVNEEHCARSIYE
jgi:hypothetical protein